MRVSFLNILSVTNTKTMKKPTDTETKGAAEALPASTCSLDGVVREFIRLLDIEEESDNGRRFRPNGITSCRAIDGDTMLKCIQEMKRLTE